MGLNEHFSVAAGSQILLMDPLPSLNHVFSMIIQHERQYGLASKRPNGRGRGFSCRKLCTFCGRTSHMVDVCYRKHGFPPNSRFENSPGAINMIEEHFDLKDEDISSAKD